MAWRKTDNWSAFTNGYQTWLNGPHGLVQWLNTERFSWETNGNALSVVLPAANTWSPMSVRQPRPFSRRR